MKILLGLVLGFAAALSCPAQENPLAGVIDIHVHSAPDSTPRSIDAIDWRGWRRARACEAWC